MNIPDKAVEAALRVAIFEDCGDMSVLAEMVPEERAAWEENVRAELEAAAPFIAAQALRDASEDLAQKLHEPGCNWGTRANDAGHLLALADLQEATQ